MCIVIIYIDADSHLKTKRKKNYYLQMRTSINSYSFPDCDLIDS